MSDKKILIIKTSSLGDVIHTLPALTDAGEKLPSIRFDWVVEQSYSEIPTWHPLVDKVISVKIRDWRKNPLGTLFSEPWKNFRTELTSTQYDTIIDAQGLLKSAFLAPMARGHRFGLDKASAREPIASHFYQSKIKVDKNQHAVERVRQLFAAALGYQVPERFGDYGIKTSFSQIEQQPYLVFLHGTSWQSKHYPEAYWYQLIEIAGKAGLKVKLLWGDDVEYQRAERLSTNFQHVQIMPKLSLREIAELLAAATAAISVDTGLGHLAAAVDCPTVSLFSATDPVLTRAYGRVQQHLAGTLTCCPCLQRLCPLQAGKLSIEDSGYDKTINPPCFSTVPPEVVWENLFFMQNSAD